jgi:hypothetical protein
MPRSARRFYPPGGAQRTLLDLEQTYLNVLVV